MVTRSILRPVLRPVTRAVSDTIRGFNPRSLFASGEQGIWLDPSDFSTLFQDSAGTTPVTALGQPVGLIRDKSGRGNHASQTTSASRPTLEARVNLIIASSENIGGAGWHASTGNTYTHNSVIVDGIGLTLVVPTVTSNNKSTYTSCEASTGIPNRVISAYCKPAGYRYIHISDASSGTLGLIVFDSQTGTFTQNSLGLTVSAVSIGSGVYKFSIVAPSTGNISPAFSASPTSTAAIVYVSTFAGDGVSGVYIGGIEVRNPADSSYPYQKVNTATDYVDVGAPRYLSFDGTDDGMATPSINFTGTDKMTVWAGVRKLSDAAAGIVCELSANLNASNGSFYLAAPASPNPHFNFSSKGATQVTVTANPFAAPITSVLNAVGDISGDISRIRVNGAQAASSASDQGTGNFGNYPLYIGRRNNASLPFNGRIYQLIVRGAASNAGQIAAGEAWCNTKTRAY